MNIANGQTLNWTESMEEGHDDLMDHIFMNGTFFLTSQIISVALLTY